MVICLRFQNKRVCVNIKVDVIPSFKNVIFIADSEIVTYNTIFTLSLGLEVLQRTSNQNHADDFKRETTAQHENFVHSPKRM